MTELDRIKDEVAEDFFTAKWKELDLYQQGSCFDEICKRYATACVKAETKELKTLLLESWQMWKDLAEAGELKVGLNYWVRYRDMKLKVEALNEPPTT